MYPGQAHSTACLHKNIALKQCIPRVSYINAEVVWREGIAKFIQPKEAFLWCSNDCLDPWSEEEAVEGAEQVLGEVEEEEEGHQESRHCQANRVNHG